ncbi:MAG: cyclic nucleotide-binding domain-containing protein [Cyanobium sp.]
MESAATAPQQLLGPLAPEIRGAITSRPERRIHAAGTVVMARQQASDERPIVASGRFSIGLPVRRPGGRERLARVSTFTPGTVFGDAAFLSRQRRMADGAADTDGSCWRLPSVTSRRSSGTIRLRHAPC